MNVILAIVTPVLILWFGILSMRLLWEISHKRGIIVESLIVALTCVLFFCTVIGSLFSAFYFLEAL